MRCPAAPNSGSAMSVHGSSIHLPSCEIHLWTAFCDDISGQFSCQYRELLSPEEAARFARFYRSTDRHRFLVTRALVRTALSRYVAVEPEAWSFSRNSYGRPFAANIEAQQFGLSFNISHSHDLVVLAVATGRALGVDVEYARSRIGAIDFSKRVLAADEMAALSLLPKEEVPDRFLEYWTFKEAYTKARGMGLAIPLNQVAFHYPSRSSVGMTIRPPLGDDPARWYVWQLRPTPKHIMAVCSGRVGPGQPSLVVRKSVPMEHEEVIPTVITRRSR